MELWTTLKVLDWTREFLAARGVENARLEAEWMLCRATGLDRVGLYLNFDKPLNETELARFREMVARRGKREPLQHILGTQEFGGVEFEVSPAVLIPRHDTEVLLDEACRRVTAHCRILDMGTGSGCIAIVLAKRLPTATVTAVDMSEAALEVARRNAVTNGVAVEFLSGSLFTPVAGRSFDLIVSNPPYIPTSDIESLEPEVRDHDPRIALDGGSDGLDFYRLLVRDAPLFLTAGGWLLLEVGCGQAPDVAGLLRGSGCFAEPVIRQDGGGRERVVAARKEAGA